MTTEQERTDRVQRAARQMVQTAHLLGVDFVPVRLGVAPAGLAEPAEPEPATPSSPDAAETTSAGTALQGKQALLDSLRQRHDAECPHCTTATGHTRTVFGEGNPTARLMFIGEAPGAEEDRTGRPFVGRAGKLLDDMIRAMGLAREEVYIANVLKARPPNNATPTAQEADKCSPYLIEQIGIIEPEAIVSLGRPAAQLLLETREPMSRLRGRWHAFHGIPVMPTFHPAYLLRQYTRENREKVWSDLKQVMDRLELSGG